MKISFFLVMIGFTTVFAASRSKRAAYDLPAGAALLFGYAGIESTFVCSKDGYYADIDNFCQIFHVCHTVVHPDGTPEMLQWSFVCGNKTVFDQFSLTCSSYEDAIPCFRAEEFWYLNGNLQAGLDVKFHNDQDVARAAAVTPGRSNQKLEPQHREAPTRPTPPTNFSKRAAYDLPAGAALLVGSSGIETTFVCRNDGYYADYDNFCQIFHVCHTVVHSDGTPEMLQWSFLCGNQTMFNQFSLTCSSYEDAIPCSRAEEFWYLNANLQAGPDVKFHNDQDVARAAVVTPGRVTGTLKPQSIEAPKRPPPPTNFVG